MASKKTDDPQAAADKAAAPVEVRFLRMVPATMLTPPGEAPDYTGPNVPAKATREVHPDVAKKLVKAGHAEAV